MFNLDDTIAAISTFPGESAVGIVRWSGPEAGSILGRLFRPASISLSIVQEWALKSHQMTYGHVVDPASGNSIDEVLAVWMQSPRTYTRQDVAEIQCHGGTVAARRILELAVRQGARLAEPGEFTLRAFLNGRLDLAQAEAVIDIVRAKTNAALRLAVRQLDGRTSDSTRQIRQALVDALAYLEALLDFPEDEIPPLDVTAAVQQARQSIESLLAQARQGMVYRNGVRTAIVGRPNVGKSSLLNALLRFDRAIVSPIPGTTRDTVEETLNLRGIPLCLVDTAGITTSSDIVESLGIARTHKAIDTADLVLMVLDGSESLRAEDRDLAASISGRVTIVVINKSDLPKVAEDHSILPHEPHVHVSALTGAGLEDLEQALADTLLSGHAELSETAVTANMRHIEILERSLAHLGDALMTLREENATDMAAVDLTAAISTLGEITGETVSDDVLNAIFRSFCVGK